MEYIWALMGFAAVFAVLSTIVTVLVEAVHKFFALRGAGMSEMMRSFHDRMLGSIQPHDIDETDRAPVGVKHVRATPQAVQFAKQMTGQSPSESLRVWYVRGWPVIRWFFRSNVERMSTLQFVEQLARTPQGAALARHDPATLGKALTAAAYEFERLGDMQLAYFKKRAKLLSVSAGLLVAAALNVDAITLYQHLARNQILTERMTALVETEEGRTLLTNALDGQVAGGAATFEEGQAAAVVAVGQFGALIGQMKDGGLPIGRGMYPWCGGAPDSLAADRFVDPRCETRDDRHARVREVLGESRAEFHTRLEETAPGGLVGSVWSNVRYVSAKAHAPFNQYFGNGILWVLGLAVSGGLLGLGAPFWFNLFSRVAAVATPAGRLLGGNAARVKAPPERSESVILRTGVRDPKATTPDALVRGYYAAQGRAVDLEGLGELSPPPGRAVDLETGAELTPVVQAAPLDATTVSRAMPDQTGRRARFRVYRP